MNPLDLRDNPTSLVPLLSPLCRCKSSDNTQGKRLTSLRPHCSLGAEPGFEPSQTGLCSLQGTASLGTPGNCTDPRSGIFKIPEKGTGLLRAIEHGIQAAFIPYLKNSVTSANIQVKMSAHNHSFWAPPLCQIHTNQALLRTQV